MRFRQLTPKISQIEIDNPKTKNNKVRWVNVCNAGKDEIEYLRKKYKFDLAHLRSSLAHKTTNRPVVEKGADYLFIILHFPTVLYNTIYPGEIEFFVGHGFLITIHNNNVGVLNDFYNLCKKDGASTLTYQYESSAVLLYELLERLLNSCFPLLDKTADDISNLEEIIFEKVEKESIFKLLELRRNILNFRKIMQNHKHILRKLMEMESSLVPANQIRGYYKKLIDGSVRIWEILENQKEMIMIYDTTYESLMNYRLSDIMKTLTIFSVIIFPLTLFATVFSMNLNGMPLASHPQGFWIIIALMLFGSIGMLLFFEKKKWL
ncbi:MAG: magnesium transporter CorA family protein [Patescibacteria group bacterium]|jgi:magnesium transporter